ncbi:hypothetical protein H9Q16_20430 [Sulfitobacter sp. TSTF-M16]|uniref:Uncharacterized protein n=2 Tax=Sulfitobacter aestuariivivens TaxID=2766981 RepID=A0A927DAQ3_9RHOB|nr:hypothetical protein [Sulfitobacter aestuariivivens]
MIIRAGLMCAIIVACWIGVLAAVMYVSDAAPAAVVMLPSDSFMATLPQGVAITGQSAISVTLSSEKGGLAAALYAAGAALVLPAGLLGCAPLTS